MSGGGFGPGFQAASSKLYRLEYAAATLAILAYLIFRWLHLGASIGRPPCSGWSFRTWPPSYPSGSPQKGESGPRGAVTLYNTFHSALAWGLAFGTLWLIVGTPYWPILGWLGHIAADRAVGYGLRSTKR